MLRDAQAGGPHPMVLEAKLDVFTSGWQPTLPVSHRIRAVVSLVATADE